MTIQADSLPAADWSYPTAIRFGIGRINELADACRQLGMTRPLLITDRGLSGFPMVKDAIAANQAADLPTGLFADISPNPQGRTIESGITVFRTGNHDGVIALGGGSALDAGKAIAFMAGQARGLWDFEDVGDNWRRADAAGMAPVVAVPTTSGTGSEDRKSVV